MYSSVDSSSTPASTAHPANGKVDITAQTPQHKARAEYWSQSIHLQNGSEPLQGLTEFNKGSEHTTGSVSCFRG